MSRADEIDKEIKDLWPDTCPECGLPAWVGAFNITCIAKTCKNGSEKERDKYAALLAEKIEWLVNQEPKPLVNPTLEELKEYEEVDPDAKTDPGYSLFKFWDDDNKFTITFANVIAEPPVAMKYSSAWCKDLDAKVKMALTPFGDATVTRLETQDAFRVAMYNKPSDLWVCETFTVEFAQGLGAGFPDWLCTHLQHTFPKELALAWEYSEYQDEIERLVLHGTGQDLYPSSKEAIRYLKIGQHILDKRVCKIDRVAGCFQVC